MFRTFRSLPVEIEAIQFTDEDKNKIYNSMSGNRWPDFEDDKPILKFITVHGDTAIARIGDWIVKDVSNGTYYPVKDEVFRKRYILIS